MNLFAAFEHGNEFLNVARASFRLLGSLNSKQNRVAIGAVQGLEETLALWDWLSARLENHRARWRRLGESYADSHRPLLLACSIA